MNADDETNITDIALLADGRICVFGTSLEVLEVLDRLQGGSDAAVNRRLRVLCSGAEVAPNATAGDKTGDRHG